jgi:2,4-dichlorophenol 6-monooxygenase
VSTHAWLVDEQGRRVSTLDLIGRGAFSAVTGLSGEVWLQAAQQVEADLGVPLRATLIGGEGARDAYGRCARLCEVNEDSVMLVRPDGYVSWRSTSSPADLTGTAEALRSALAAILGR